MKYVLRIGPITRPGHTAYIYTQKQRHARTHVRTQRSPEDGRHLRGSDGVDARDPLVRVRAVRRGVAVAVAAGVLLRRVRGHRGLRVALLRLPV